MKNSAGHIEYRSGVRQSAVFWNRHSRALNLVIVILAALLASPILIYKAKAAAGDLDLTFGSNGKVTTDFGGTTDYSNAVVLQPDGKIIVAGHDIINYPASGFFSDFALARYNPDGSLDPTFGNGGEVITNVTGYAEAMALQPDGKIIAGGHVRVGYHDNDIELARFNSDGSPDTSFGNTGVVKTTFFSGSDDLARTIALQPDGKIIAAGHTGNYPRFDLAIVRYTSEGQLDPSFGSNGKVSTDFFGSWEEADGLAIQPDGKIVMVGEAETPSGLDVALVRYLSPSSCTYSLSATSAYFPPHGGSGSVNLTTGGGCNWTVSCSDNWIALTSPVSGAGNTTITFEVRENFTGSVRTATITVGSQTFTLIQDGALGGECSYSISPTFDSFSANGGSGSVQVSSSERCGWEAVSEASWITITSNSSGTGNGTITYSVAANTSKSGRKGTITIGKQVFSIKQKGG